MLPDFSTKTWMRFPSCFIDMPPDFRTKTWMRFSICFMIDPRRKSQYEEETFYRRADYRLHQGA